MRHCIPHESKIASQEPNEFIWIILKLPEAKMIAIEKAQQNKFL